MNPVISSNKERSFFYDSDPTVDGGAVGVYVFNFTFPRSSINFISISPTINFDSPGFATIDFGTATKPTQFIAGLPFQNIINDVNLYFPGNLMTEIGMNTEKIQMRINVDDIIAGAFFIKFNYNEL